MYEAELRVASTDWTAHPLRQEDIGVRNVYATLLLLSVIDSPRSEREKRNVIDVYVQETGLQEPERFRRLLKPDGIKEWKTLRHQLADSGGSSKALERFCRAGFSSTLLAEIAYVNMRFPGYVSRSHYVRSIMDFFRISPSLLQQIEQFLVEWKRSGTKALSAASQSLAEQNPLLGELMKQRERFAASAVSASASRMVRAAVFATMKAGKSTLLNAIAGKPVFPSETRACTAKPIEYKSLPPGAAANRLVGLSEGIDAIDARWELSAEDVALWNADGAGGTIRIAGPTASASMPRQACCTITDTPGANNALDRSHGEAAKRFFASSRLDVVLYILNVQELGCEDDKALLEWMLEQKRSRKSAGPRFVFVLNKADRLDLEGSDNIGRTVKLASDYLTGLGVRRPVIIPASGYAAYLFRSALDGRGEELSMKERLDLAMMSALFRQPAYDLALYAGGRRTGAGADFPKPEAEAGTGSETVIIGGIPYLRRELAEALRRTGMFEIERHLASRSLTNRK